MYRPRVTEHGWALDFMDGDGRTTPHLINGERVRRRFAEPELSGLDGAPASRDTWRGRSSQAKERPA